MYFERTIERVKVNDVNTTKLNVCAAMVDVNRVHLELSENDTGASLYEPYDLCDQLDLNDWR